MMRVAVLESEFYKKEMKINGKKVTGRDVYGFFLTEEEFEKVSPELLSNGVLGSLDRVDPRFPRIESGKDLFESKDSEDIKELIKRGGNIFGKKDVAALLSEKGLPIREILSFKGIMGFKK